MSEATPLKKTNYSPSGSYHLSVALSGGSSQHVTHAGMLTGLISCGSGASNPGCCDFMKAVALSCSENAVKVCLFVLRCIIGVSSGLLSLKSPGGQT